MAEKYDLVIVGSGPAGMSAAVNAWARDKSVAIFESSQLAKKITWAPNVDNYLGFYNISGEELAQKFIDHINGLEIPIIQEKVVQIFSMGEYFTVTTNHDNYQAKRILLATGVNQEAKIAGEAEYVGQGVSYCATCDGRLYRDKDVLVISDSQHHEEEANFLADLANEVLYIADYEEIGSLDQRIKVIDGEVKEITKAEKMIAQLEDKEYQADGLFILRESIPPNEIINGLEIDGRHIKVDRNFATNIAGVYAAGDCTGGPLQISKAVGEGQVAALHALKNLNSNE